VIQDVNHKKFSNGGVIVVEDDHDVIHFNNSSDFTLSTSLNDLDFATLNIDGQSTDVKAPPDIIDVDEDDDFIDDEDVFPHDLADFDDEVLANDDDDVVISTTVARGHGGDGGGDDPSRPPPHSIRIGFRGVGGRKATREAGRLGTSGETRNLGLKKITDEWGPLKIRFEWNDKGTMLHLDENFVQWSNLIGEIAREYLMYYPSWNQIKEEKKAGVLGWLMKYYDI
ncbi:hypothetical protein Tco_1298376, partial [Tanacetum coccineum]